MADKLVFQDTAKPGVLKVLGPTLTVANRLLLTSLDNTTAVNGQGIILTAGDWAPGNPASADTASNLGAGQGVFKSKVAADFQFKSLIAGTSISITNNANDLTINATSTSPFSASFTSTDQVITAGGALTLAHGLGAAPTLVQTRLKAINSVLGYTAGNEVIMSTDAQESGDFGTSIVPDATNLNVRIGSNPGASYRITRKDTGATAAITNTDWSLIVRAWR